jgi:hypothetical protein
MHDGYTTCGGLAALRGLREMVMGKEHPSTLTSINKPAGVLTDQGRYDQAEQMPRRAFKAIGNDAEPRAS